MPRGPAPLEDKVSHSRFAFWNPFKYNHCVPLAYAHCANMDEEDVKALAKLAQEYGEQVGATFLTSNGMARNPKGQNGVDFWCGMAGLKNIGRVPFKGTLKTLAKHLPTGRYIVFVRGHAVALMEGKFYGSYRLLTRVEEVWRVERLFGD